MGQILEIALGVVLGLGLIGGVFWFAFRQMPDAREPPVSGTDVTSQWNTWEGGSNDDLPG